MEPTPRHKSKTNIIASIITVLGVVIQSQDTLAPMFGDYGGVVMAAIGGVMMVLREVTKTPIAK